MHRDVARPRPLENGNVLFLDRACDEGSRIAMKARATGRSEAHVACVAGQGTLVRGAHSNNICRASLAKGESLAFR